MTDQGPNLLRTGPSAATVDRSRSRILLFSYHFPPGPGTGGARWAKFSSVLDESGWGLDVVTLDPSCMADPEWNRMERLPDHVRVIGARQERVWLERLEDRLGSLHSSVKENFRAASGSTDEEGGTDEYDLLPGMRAIPVEALPPIWSSPRSLLRAYWSWVDHARQRAWIREALECAREIVDPKLHRLIVTTGPPHLSHAAGRALSEETGLPLVLDFRDPWKVTEVLQEHLASPAWLRVAEREEPRCVERASLIVANTDALRSRLASEYPAASDRTTTVPNGWAPPIGTDVEAPERFIIAYAGAIYLDRNPRALMKAIASLVRKRGLRLEELSVEFMGDMKELGPGLRTMADQENIADYVRLHDESPREEARRFLGRASVLVSLPQSQSLAVPSKIFDYMTLPAWIVAQSATGSATERLLRETRAEVVPPDDHRALRRALEDKYDEYTHHGRPAPLAASSPNLRVDQVLEPLLEHLERWRETGGSA